MANLYILAGIPGCGKAQPVDTIIPTPDGDKRLGDIAIGDYVFDRLGKPTKVLGVFPQGKLDNYKVTFKDGRSTYCNDEHLWSYYTSKGNLKTSSLRELINNGLCLKNFPNHHKYYIPTNECVEYSHKDYSVHPYIIGAFLGDGCCLQKQLTISSNDEFIVKKISSLLPIKNEYKKNSDKNYNWAFKATNPHYSNIRQKYIYTSDILGDFSKELMCYSYDKRIPSVYLYGDREQRLELLRGLLDTDGSISISGNRFNVGFVTTSSSLMQDFTKLVRSLGFTTGKIHVDNRNKYTNGCCYETTLLIDNENKEEFFSLPRKCAIGKMAKGYHKRARYDRTCIVDIEKMPEKEEMVCIYVDNDEHLYLTNDFIVTHNTTWAHEHYAELDAKIVSRDYIRFKYMANDPDFLPSMDYFKYESDVIKDFYSQINDNLYNDINVIADATHISWKSLRKTVENCGKNADKIILVYFNRGLDIALPQNAKRGGVEHVPEDVIKRMWAGRYMPARAKVAGLIDEYTIV